MATKYEYSKVIQQNYGQGWEDVSEYECNSQGVTKEMSGKTVTSPKGRVRELTLLEYDYAEYVLLGYPTRSIKRRILKV